MDPLTRKEWGFFTVLAAAAAALALMRPDKAIDYQVYFWNARHYFRDGALMYGPASGMAWPGGIYRYPPIFLDLFRAFALLPIRLGTVIWAAGKMVCGGWLVICLRRRWSLASVARFWPGLLLLAPYMIQGERNGNAQFYIVVMVAAAFLLGDERPHLAGFWLGFGAALKIWPLFFFPWLAVQRRWRMLSASVVAAAGWTALPVLWRGWHAQWTLLGQWLAQERFVAATSARYGELWYPGQSLHDVMARYLSVVDYSQLTDANYRQVAWLHLARPTVEMLWWAAAMLLVAGLFYILASSLAAADALVALMFAGEVLIEPHVHRIIFTTLLWPVLWLSSEWEQGRLRGWQRTAFFCAVAVAALEPLVPGGAHQRLFQVYGTDFLFVIVPVAVVMAARTWPVNALRRNSDLLTDEAAAH